jgi:hypothetical protein
MSASTRHPSRRARSGNHLHNDPGATLATLVAPHRRAAFFTDQYALLTEEGQGLFEATIYWAVRYVELGR